MRLVQLHVLSVLVMSCAMSGDRSWMCPAWGLPFNGSKKNQLGRAARKHQWSINLFGKMFAFFSCNVLLISPHISWSIIVAWCPCMDWRRNGTWLTRFGSELGTLDGSSWQPCLLQHLQYPPGKTGKTCNLCTYLLSYYCLLLLGGTLSRTSGHLCRWYLFVNCWHFVKSAVQSWSLQRLVYTAWSGVQTSEWRLWSENPVMLGQHL